MSNNTSEPLKISKILISDPQPAKLALSDEPECKNIITPVTSAYVVLEDKTAFGINVPGFQILTEGAIKELWSATPELFQKVENEKK